MYIVEKQINNFIIIELNGKLDTSTFMVLEEKLTTLMENEHSNILLDCSNLEYISSSGLRVLLMAIKKIAFLNGHFGLCSLHPEIYKVFDISGFTGIFKIYSNCDEALKNIN